MIKASMPEKDWRDQLRDIGSSAAAQIDRNLFKDLNPDQDHSPILASPPTTPRPASVLIPVVDRQAGPTILMTVRTPTMPSHAGQISFPGGGPKGGDQTPIDTALREAHEEVGINPDWVTVTAKLGVHFGGLGYAVTPVVGLVAPAGHLRRCEREVDEIFEVPLDHFLKLDNHIVERRTFREQPYRMFAVPYHDDGENRHIWGLTAGILHTFAHAYLGLEW